jgi:hypothetical protein
MTPAVRHEDRQLAEGGTARRVGDSGAGWVEGGSNPSWSPFILDDARAVRSHRAHNTRKDYSRGHFPSRLLCTPAAPLVCLGEDLEILPNPRVRQNPRKLRDSVAWRDGMLYANGKTVTWHPTRTVSPASQTGETGPTCYRVGGPEAGIGLDLRTG